MNGKKNRYLLFFNVWIVLQCLSEAFDAGIAIRPVLGWTIWGRIARWGAELELEPSCLLRWRRPHLANLWVPRGRAKSSASCFAVPFSLARDQSGGRCLSQRIYPLVNKLSCLRRCQRLVLSFDPYKRKQMNSLSLAWYKSWVLNRRIAGDLVVINQDDRPQYKQSMVYF